MQEYNDGSYGDIMQGEDLLKKLSEDQSELARTKAIHFGTEEELQEKKNKTPGAFGSSGIEKECDSRSVKEYLREIEGKMDMIIKHFNIVHII